MAMSASVKFFGFIGSPSWNRSVVSFSRPRRCFFEGCCLDVWILVWNQGVACARATTSVYLRSIFAAGSWVLDPGCWVVRQKTRNSPNGIPNPLRCSVGIGTWIPSWKPVSTGSGCIVRKFIHFTVLVHAELWVFSKGVRCFLEGGSVIGSGYSSVSCWLCCSVAFRPDSRGFLPGFPGSGEGFGGFLVCHEPEFVSPLEPLGHRRRIQLHVPGSPV